MKRSTIGNVVKQLGPFATIGRTFWLPYTVTLLLTVIATLLSAVVPLVFGRIIDTVSYAKNEMNKDTLFGSIIMLIFIYLSLQMTSSGLKAWANYTAASHSEKISHYLRTRLTKTIFHNDPHHELFFQNDHGKILSFYSRDIESLWDLFGFAITDLVSSVIMILVLCTIVIFINPALGIILITISVSFALAFYWNGHQVRHYFAEAAPKFDQMIGFISAALRSYETIVSYRAQFWTNKTIKQTSEDVTRLANKAHLRSTSFTFVTSCINLLGLLVVWIVCLPGLLGETKTYFDITLGQFVAILAYFSMVMGPLENISCSAKAISKGIVSIKRLSLFVDQQPTPPIHVNEHIDDEQISPSPALFLLQVTGLKYTGYSETNQPVKILNGITFYIEHGEMVGLAGESGSGKSTLLRLLARLMKPCDGIIFTQGINFNDILEDEFRALFRYVPQESAIFPVDIKQNLTLKNLNEGKIVNLQKAVKKASAPTVLDRFNGQSDMTAAGLSGGEAQRISLARAFLKSAPTMLIDEPTSALDLTNSMQISQSLQTIARNGTVIVASHDKHVLEKCNRVLVLSNGLIIESGTHNQLQHNSELYRSIISSAGV